MSMRRFILVCAAALLAAIGARAEAAEWKRLDSEHFTLYARVSNDTARAYLTQLEGLHWLTLKLLGDAQPAVGEGSRFEFYMRPETDDDNVTMKGTYCWSPEGPVATAVGIPAVGEARVVRQLLLEAYADHLLIQHASASFPLPWYLKGFAEYLSATSIEDGDMYMGGIHAGLLDILRTHVWLPYADVLNWNWNNGPSKRSGREMETFAAQAWLLVHYLKSNAERTQQLFNYLDRVSNGEDRAAAMEAATGLTLDELNRQLWNYASGSLKRFKLRRGAVPQPAIETTALGSEADAYMDDLMTIKGCATAERKKAAVARLRERAPHPSQAGTGLRLALARAEAVSGDPRAAIAILDAHLASDAGNAEAYYLLGRAWGRLAGEATGDEQRAARQREREHLAKARDLGRSDAPTLYFLAQALERDGAGSQALEAARAARLLVPAVREYAVFEARLDLRAGDRLSAVRALEPLAFSTVGPAARMRQAIDAIRAGKSADEVNALMNPEPTNPATP